MAEKIKNGSYNQKGAELTFANEEVIPVEDWPTEIIKKKWYYLLQYKWLRLACITYLMV